MTQLTLGPALICIAIAAVCLFILLAKTGHVVRVFNWIGGGLQWAFAALKGIFTKK